MFPYILNNKSKFTNGKARENCESYKRASFLWEIGRHSGWQKHKTLWDDDRSLVFVTKCYRLSGSHNRNSSLNSLQGWEVEGQGVSFLCPHMAEGVRKIS